jgi:hypothetical protein
MKSIATRIALVVSLAVSSTAAYAVEVGGVNVPDRVTVNNQNLVLNGAGMRKKLFIKVYTGALYLPAKQANPASILAADTPRRMAMHFVFNVDKAKIAEAWTEGLDANVPGAAADVRTAFKTLESWMEDMKKGQAIVLTYVPGTGTTVEVNGKVKGTLGGKSVADAILATWIGPKPGPGDDFKAAVLGK